MKSITLTILCLLCIVSGTLVPSGSTASAADLIEISIASHEQAEQARMTYGTAVARDGNTFFVLAEPTAMRSSDANRRASEPLLSDVDVDQLYLFTPTRRVLLGGTVDIDLLGTRVELDDGRYFMRLSRAVAASLAGSLQGKELQPCEVRVPFKFQPPSVSMPLADDFPHDTLAALIDQDSLYAFNKRLEDFYTRFILTDSIDRARDWMVGKFEGFGYTDVSTQQFWHSSTFGSGYAYNVVAVKPGYAEPDQVILIGAHYDSFTRGERWLIAPGADDNGSGTALVMEVARVLASAQLRKTVIFVAFSAEEPMFYGLSGATYAADLYAAANTKLEVMFNYDMVGYNTNAFYELYSYSKPYDAYQDMCAAAAIRNTDIIPIDPASPLPGDNYPFEDQGYTIVRVAEAEFNDPNYHMESDLCAHLDFAYMAEIARTAVVSVAIVADAAYPVEVYDNPDPGDGQSLLVTWDDCSSDCTYKIYWGETSGVYTDSADVTPGECSYTMTGLTDGQQYYMTVIGESPNGSRALYGVEGTGVPMLYPRIPSGIAGESSPDDLRLSISWAANQELDFSHYNVYRRFGSVGNYNLYAEGVTATSFVDDDVVPHVGYDYAVSAVDLAGYESSLSEGVMLYPATYDGGVIVADAFVMDHYYDPDQAWQEAWLDTVLGGVGFSLASADEWGGPVTLSQLGQYSTVLWIDDDVIDKSINESEAALTEFSKHNTNMLISGYRTFVNWTARSVPSSHLLYREFGLTYFETIAYFDFIGAHGQNGWPSVAIDPTRGMNEWRDIPKLVGHPGATVIGTFDSFMDLPGWEGEPVGLAYETANGKRVLLSFPLYYLTPASAQALLAKVMEYFGTGIQYDKGDLDHSGTINIGDVALLLDHLFINQLPLPDPDAADMDGRPGVSIGDAFILINFLFLGGPQPAN